MHVTKDPGSWKGQMIPAVVPLYGAMTQLGSLQYVVRTLREWAAGSAEGRTAADSARHAATQALPLVCCLLSLSLLLSDTKLRFCACTFWENADFGKKLSDVLPGLLPLLQLTAYSACPCPPPPSPLPAPRSITKLARTPRAGQPPRLGQAPLPCQTLRARRGHPRCVRAAASCCLSHAVGRCFVVAQRLPVVLCSGVLAKQRCLRTACRTGSGESHSGLCHSCA